MAMVEIHNLRYHYQDAQVPAVDGASFNVDRGEIFGLLGPNGAGKSTLIHILTTMLQTGKGAIQIGGRDLNESQMLVRQDIGVVFQDPSLDERLTAYENLFFHARLYHLPARQMAAAIRNALELVGLWERRDDFVMKYSGGMKRRLEIARAIVHQPDLLVLDEPTIGLDPQSRRQIWDYVLKLREERGLTALLTTHYLEEAEICDRIAIMDHGKIIALDTPDNLKQEWGGEIIVVRAENSEIVRQIIQDRLQVQVLFAGDELRIQVADGSSFMPRLFAVIGDCIRTVDIKKSTLEDVFIKLTGREIRAGGVSETERIKNTVKSRWIR